MKTIIRKIRMRFMKRGIGKLAKKYSKLTQQTERASFLMQQFGREWEEYFTP
jgi:hypothetical protein